MAKRKKPRAEGINHRQIFLEDRQHMIDILVLPVCRLLWINGIETFFSCQGGPVSRNINTGKIHKNRAYVQILERDAEKACLLLKDLHPKIDINPKRVHKDRVAIRFDPCDQAKNAQVVLLAQ